MEATMHPDLAREMMRQRTGERQARGAKAEEARAAREAARDRRDQAAARAVPLPRIPDYVDGSFLADGAARETGDSTHAR
jgi:hypothetical protein